MNIVHADAVFRVEPGTSPDYRRDNPLLSLLRLVEETGLAEERDAYLSDSFQYLVPFQSLTLYGPSGASAEVSRPEQQDDKQDFQKQNVKDFRAADTLLVRGWASLDDWTGPFLHVSYRGGPDSVLSQRSGHQLGERLRLWLKVGDAAGQLLTVPYNPDSGRYEVELWGYPRNDLRERLGDKGRSAFDRGALLARNELVHGHPDDFGRERMEGAQAADVARDSSMHPVLPLRVELAWADEHERVWDSQDGANHRYSFAMVVRGWEQYLSVGGSENPHGGVGALEYRTLLSNYGPHAARAELGRVIPPWSFDAAGRKQEGTRSERFLAVDYMDLHILRAGSGIGLHRHRDNQEAFLMMEGRGYMVVGDWCQLPDRERCFEVRVLRAGHLALLKGGQLHGLMNPSDEDLSLFMFGGYD